MFYKNFIIIKKFVKKVNSSWMHFKKFLFIVERQEKNAVAGR